MELRGQIGRFSKEELFAFIGYKTYPEPDGRNPVEEYHQSTTRWRIVSAPARTSKSYASSVDHIYDVFPEIFTSEDGKVYPMGWNWGTDRHYTHSLGWIVAPDYKLCKEYQYLWDILVDGKNRFGFGFKLEKQQNNPDQGNMRLTILWGLDPSGTPIKSTIEGKSSTNERSLQAEEVHWAIMSEAADQDARILNKYLATRVGKLSFPTTPKINAAWLKELIDMSEDSEEIDADTGEHSYPLDIQCFYFSRHCNPNYDHDRFSTEERKAEMRVGQGKGQAWKDAEFAEQFLGKWTYAADAAVPFRHADMGDGRICHVLQELPDWVPYARKFVSTDYGYTDPAAAGWFAVGSDGTVVLYREFYRTGCSAMDFVNAIQKATKDAKDEIEYYVGDPKKPEVAHHFARLGMHTVRVNKKRQSDRQAGHMQICDMLADDPAIGRPRFFIYKECKNAVNEFKLLRRKRTVTGEFSPTSFAGKDHMYDCVRYFLTTDPRGQQMKSSRQEIDEIREHVLRLQRRGRGSFGGQMIGRTPGLMSG